MEGYNKYYKHLTCCSVVVVVLNFSSLFLAPVYALSPDKDISQYVHDVWKNKDGLPQSSITSMAQTADGYLWIGTLEGLVRFDGLKFTLFNSRNTFAFKHNFITRLLVDKQNQLWIATSDGLLRYQNNQFTLITEESDQLSREITTLYEDVSGRIWIGTEGSGLYYIHNKKFVKHSKTNGIKSKIHSIAGDKDNMWVGTDAGLIRVGDNGLTEIFFEDHNVRSLLHDSQGRVWVSSDQGVFWLADMSLMPVDFGGVEFATVIKMIEDRDHNIWFASDGGGVIRWHDGKVSIVNSDRYLSNNSVISLFESDEGNLWVGTNLGGLNRYKEGRMTTFTRDQGLSNDFIRSVFESSSGALWVGTEGSGLMKYSPSSGFENILMDQELGNKTIYAMSEREPGRIFLGTDMGLIELKERDDSIIKVNQLFSNNIVLTVHEDDNQTIWIGTYAEGLKKIFNGETIIFNTETGLGNNTVNVIYEDSKNVLWVGTRGGGLTRIEGNELTTFTSDDGLSSDMVFSIHEDRQGVLWVGTYGGGLNRFTNNKFEAITEAHGLFDNVIHRIVEDRAGYFWFSSNRGIWRVKRHELVAIADGVKDLLNSDVFGLEDGMKNLESNGGANASVLTKTGDLWFPSVEGLVRVDLKAERSLRPAPTLMLEKVRIDGTETELDSIAISSGANHLDIDYTAIELSSPEKLQFSYRLLGYDEMWVDAGTRRSAYYTQLPAGDYQFQLRLNTNAHSQSSSNLDIPIMVEPRLIERFWFRMLMFMTALVFARFLYRVRVNHLTSKAMVLEGLVEKRTEELLLANKKLEKLATEDGLTGVHNRRSFDYLLDIECRRSARAKQPVSLLMIDIDYFKQYNDLYGHLSGDQCLRTIATILQITCARASEVAARYGGEEFSVILPNVNYLDAERLANKLRDLIQKQAIVHADSSVSPYVTVSIGVATAMPPYNLSPEKLLQHADKYLYNAKSAGRNCVVGGEILPPNQEAEDFTCGAITK